MKVDTSFSLRTIGDIHLIVPLSKDSFSPKNVLTINETGAFLWKRLCELNNKHPREDITLERIKKELLASLQTIYEVDDKTALADITSFLKKLFDFGAIYKE